MLLSLAVTCCVVVEEEVVSVVGALLVVAAAEDPKKMLISLNRSCRRINNRQFLKWRLRNKHSSTNL